VRYDGKRGVVWRIKFVDAAGQQVQKTLGREADGWSRKKAEAELRERLVRVERKAYRRPKPLTLAQYASLWLDTWKVKRNLRPKSIASYGNSIGRLTEHLGPFPLGAIRPRHVEHYIREQLEAGYSATTANYDVSLLYTMFESAIVAELVDSNPARSVDRPKQSGRKWRILTPVEASRVMKEFDDERARLTYMTLLLCGLRRHEIQNLRWRHVSLVENTLRVVDSKSEHGRRSIAIPPGLAEALWQYRRGSAYQGENDFVFAHPRKGSRLDADWFGGQFRVAMKRAGIAGYIRPMHDLRHTMITNDAATNSNPFAVMTKAGHKAISTTNTYIHLAGQVFHDEAEALERRMLGSTSLYRPERTAYDPGEPQPVEQAASDAQ
jgi:integrase